MNWLYIIAILIGPIFLIARSVHYSLTHQKEIKKAVKTKQKNVPYSQKLPANYTPAEKRWASLTIFVLLIDVIIAIYFLLIIKNTTLASLTIGVGIIVWKVMIILGDKSTKKK